MGGLGPFLDSLEVVAVFGSESGSRFPDFIDDGIIHCDLVIRTPRMAGSSSRIYNPTHTRTSHHATSGE